MPTKYADLFAELCAPFPPKMIRVKNGPGGKQLHYVTARVVANRLDNVLGPEYWWDEYRETKDGLVCRITVELPSGKIVSKEDGGGYAGMTDSDDNEKSGFSSAFKRAAAKFGVGRYLYDDGVPDFASSGHPEVESPRSSPPHRMSRPPSSDDMSQAETPRRNFSPNGQTGGVGGNAPRSGKALFAWSKKVQEEFDVNMVDWINDWAKTQNLPPRMVDWSEPEVARGYQAACQELQSQGFSVGGGAVSNQSRSESEPSIPPRPAQQSSHGKTATVDRHQEVVNLRKRIITALWTKAKEVHPGTTDPEHFWNALDEANQVVELPPGAEPIRDINAGDGPGYDPEVLTAYLTALGTY
jgi:hypothetical protein